ncbi:MAG: hypothetical protein AAGG51_01945 [Cyanobacteria bacterium P01_G01_bin.54]
MNSHKSDELIAKASEVECLWDKQTPYEDILNCVEKHSFGEMNEFYYEFKVNGPGKQPYSHKTILQKLKRYKCPSILVQDSNFQNSVASINSSRLYNTIKIFARRQYCEEKKIQPQQGIEFIREISSILLDFHMGTVSGEFKVCDFYNENDIDWAPKCFNYYLTWMHFLHPSYYTKYLTREDILGMPAQEIQEWENGIIQVQMFDHPFNYDTPENRQIIVEASEYLNERHRIFRASQKNQ